MRDHLRRMLNEPPTLKSGLLLFAVGAAVYPLLELAFRGWSHWSMSLAGGVGLNLLINCRRGRQSWPLLRLALLGALLLSLWEFIVGCVVNRWLHLAVWDYSHLPGNIWGQVCLPFTALWFMLTLPVYALCRRLDG
ncbi:MAG: hypothetical protein Q4B96_07750 [Bacillota bacterium]|nr:hypothetical protein [Bacillota bacterium]